MMGRSKSKADLPVVGDWLAVESIPNEDKMLIRAILPRQNKFSRKAVQAGGPKYGPGKTDEQILASNIDIAFLELAISLVVFAYFGYFMPLILCLRKKVFYLNTNFI